MRIGSDYKDHLDLEKLKEYLLYLLKILNSYKRDWEITEDEYNLFRNELTRFKQLSNNSTHIPEEIKSDIALLSFREDVKRHKLKRFMRYLFLWDAAAYRANQVEDKGKIEDVESSLNKILNKIILS
jgi:hypothetical protein